MSYKDQPLPMGEHIACQYRQMRPLIRLLGFFNTNIRRQAKDLEQQFADLEHMKEDRKAFATRFGLQGWTIYDRLSFDAVRAAVAEPDDDLAEKRLISYHLNPDNLRFLGHRFHTSRFGAWCEIYERAVERLSAEDYLSAVPLILIIIDGICTSKTGKHPFSGGVDAPVFDTETTGPGGISNGLAVLGATRRKLDTEPINSPYRHGILHGLNPNFGNSRVAAKAVNLLQTMVDYFDRRDDQEDRMAKAAQDQRQPSWAELAATISETRDTKRRIDEWLARPAVVGKRIASAGELNNFETDSPEATAAIYLDAIITRNFGLLAKLSIDRSLRSMGYRAGRRRQELGQLKLTHWSIIGIRDEAPAVSVVDVSMEGLLDDISWSGNQTMRLIYSDEKFETLVRGAPNGSWTVMPNFLPTLWGTAVGHIQSTGTPDEGSNPSS